MLVVSSNATGVSNMGTTISTEPAVEVVVVALYIGCSSLSSVFVSSIKDDVDDSTCNDKEVGSTGSFRLSTMEPSE